MFGKEPMNLALSLAATFFAYLFSAAGTTPLILSGDMGSDFRLHATDATCCAVERMPSANLLASWKKLGVKMLKRIPYDESVSPEYLRRKAGFLAFVEGADGVWLEDEAKYSESWQIARCEAEKDRAVAEYLNALADRAIALREKSVKIWIEGRRVKWMFHALDFSAEDLDCLRLDFIASARRLEQLVGAPKKDLPMELTGVSTAGPCPQALLDRTRKPRPVACDGVRTDLFGGLSFSASRGDFTFTLSGGGDGGLTGRVFRLRFDLPGKEGDTLPYECVIDLTPDERGPQASLQGPVFASERFNKGRRRLYGDGHDWRCEMYHRRSNLPESPYLTPSFRRTNEKDGCWTASVSFEWMPIVRFSPTLRVGERDRWLVSLSEDGGRELGSAVLLWPQGTKKNLDARIEAVTKKRINEAFDGAAVVLREDYSRWHSERLYRFAETPEPTFHRFGKESDAMFTDRVLEPFLKARRNAADRLALLPLVSSVSRLRRDYLIGRFAGRLPPPVEHRKSEVVCPDVDREENKLELEEKED